MSFLGVWCYPPTRTLQYPVRIEQLTISKLPTWVALISSWLIVERSRAFQASNPAYLTVLLYVTPSAQRLFPHVKRYHSPYRWK